MEYVYEGPGPHDDGDGGIVRPGDVRDFDAEPGWGPWHLLGDEPPDGAEKPAEPPATRPPAAAASSPPPASTPPPGPKTGE